MGSVDIIPGISGGTIAFITGIYHELIKSIDKFSLKMLIKGQFKIFWSEISKFKTALIFTSNCLILFSRAVA